MFFINSSILFLVDWIDNALNSIGLFFEAVIATFVEYFYNLFQYAAQMNLNTLGPLVNGIMNRIMTLVGILVLFTTAFSFIKYMVDPDQFSSKQEGGSKIASNVMVVVIMLTLVYSGLVFGVLNDFQTLMFGSSNSTFQYLDKLGDFSATNSDVIGKIIFGKESKVEDDGNFIARNVLGSFIYVTDKKSQDWKNYGDTDAEKVLKEIATDSSTEVSLFSKWIKLTSLSQHVKKEVTYVPVIGMIIGCFLIYLFISFSIDVMSRSLKLMLLQMIAPIPIVLYITKKGKEIFKSYVKLYLKIYVELFLKLAMIYLSVEIITQLMQNSDSRNMLDEVFGGGIPWHVLLLLKVLLICALFAFAKSGPKIIADIFGINLSSSKEERKRATALLGGMFGSAIGSTASMTAAAVSGAGVGGTLKAGFKGGYGGAKSGFTSKSFVDFTKGQISNPKQFYQSRSARFEGRESELANQEKNISNINTAIDKDLASSFNSSWSSRDDYINNNSDVKAAKKQLEDYQGFVEALGEKAYQTETYTETNPNTGLTETKTRLTGNLDKQYSDQMRALKTNITQAEGNARANWKTERTKFVNHVTNKNKKGKYTNSSGNEVNDQGSKMALHNYKRGRNKNSPKVTNEASLSKAKTNVNQQRIKNSARNMQRMPNKKKK